MSATKPSSIEVPTPGDDRNGRREGLLTAPGADDSSRAVRDGVPRTRARVRYNAWLKIVRRAHLFTGLLLVPWGLLYGVTGFLFNHPDAFPDREARTLGPSQLSGTRLEGFPTAPELADRVVEALNAKAGGEAFRLVDRPAASYSRRLFVTATGRGREHSVQVDPDSGTATVRSSATTGDRPSPLPPGLVLTLADSPRDLLARAVPELLGRLGLEADSVSVRNTPDLVCSVEAEGRRWRVAYNIQTGATTVRPADDPNGRLSTRRFLTGLHLSFAYPSEVGTRWAWAVAVDAMAAAMVFWSLSGLLMWWQMKSLRRAGALVLIASIALAALMAVGMHGLLSA
jgi:hypothetical protein